jgi:spermidine synthase
MMQGPERGQDGLRLRIAVLALGVAACVAQVLLTREIVVSFFGNELTIGLALATWLVGITGGALVAKGLGRRIAGRRVVPAAATVLAAFGVALPLLLHLSRVVRSVAGVPVGEVGSLGQVLLGSVAVCMPCGLAVGFVFPVLCMAGIAEGGPRTAVPGSLYGWESVGSMLAGVLLSWWVLPRAGGMLIAVGGGLIAVAGAAFIVSRRRGVAAMCLASAIAVSGCATGVVARVEAASVEARWRHAGLLHSGMRLVSSRDTAYQNLAILEQAGQNALYANGQVCFVFPDPMAAEIEIHAILAQKPDARAVLVLGTTGNDVLDVLLRHPIRRLVQVDLDPVVREMVDEVERTAGASKAFDGRLARISGDGVRYVAQTDERFDLVVVRASQPSTLAAGRYYTEEFYRQVRRILNPGGVLASAVDLSERMEATAALLGASMDRTLRCAFPVVVHTAGARVLFFAGEEASGLTLERSELVRRSRGEGFTGSYFRPEFFLAVDDYDPDKIAQVRSRLHASSARVNRLTQPVSTLYHTMLWQQVSGTRGWAAVYTAAVAIGLIVVVLCLTAFRAGPGQERRRGLGSVLILTLATTGIVSMATELVLILALQSLCGYAYTRMATVFGAFMLGLAVGASGVRRSLATPARAVRVLLVAEAALGLLAVCPFLLLSGSAAIREVPGGAFAMEAAVYLLVLLVGTVTGAEFPLGVNLLSEASRLKGSVALADAADHVGAAVGALLTAAVLVPCLGIAATVWLLAGVKLASSAALAAVYVRSVGCVAPSLRGRAVGGDLP